MPRFFSDNITNTTAVISGSDAVHIGRSLRMRLGDELVVCKDGMEYTTKIHSISDEQVVCDILSSAVSQAEPDIKLTLFQAMPKSDKLDLIVQKAVELGVVRICPVLTSRCVSRPDKKNFEKKQKRLQKIALEGAKQSGRGIIPEVSDILTLKECIDRMAEMDLGLVCYEKGGKPLSETGLKKGTEIGVLIGSEGGFDEGEIRLCIEKGIVPIGLGPRILRCETAPISAISIIMNLTGNM